MIPARAGSERLKLKNMRLIAGKPMIQYAIEKAKEADVCDRIVVNSDSNAFKAIAADHDVEFFLRPKSLGSSDTKADDVVYNFMNNFPGDLLVWVNPTSPLQSIEEIREVVKHLLSNPSVDTLITVNNYQRHAVMKKKGPLNFDPNAKGDKTQDLTPVSVAVYSILAWQYKPFKQSYEENGGFGYFNGKIDYYEVSALSGIIIKYKQDMDLAEAVLLQKGEGIPPPPGGHPEYHELADVIFEGSDEEFQSMPAEDRQLVVVLSTWVGEESSSVVVNNIRQIFKYHPEAIVHVIDNDSASKEHLTELRVEYSTGQASGKVFIDELKTTGYELGACSFAWKKYKGVHPLNSNWLCMQDLMELQRKLPLEILNNQLIMPLYYFTYPLFPNGIPDEKIVTWTDGPVPTKVIRDSKTLGSDGFEALFSMPEWKTEFLMYAEDARMPVWTKLIMKELGFTNQVRSAVFANSFATTGDGMRKLEEVGLWDIVVDQKWKSQACERLLGGIFAGLGWEPYLYALASKGIMVSKGRNFERNGLYVKKLENRLKEGYRDSLLTADEK